MHISSVIPSNQANWYNSPMSDPAQDTRVDMEVASSTKELQIRLVETRNTQKYDGKQRPWVLVSIPRDEAKILLQAMLKDLG